VTASRTSGAIFLKSSQFQTHRFGDRFASPVWIVFGQFSCHIKGFPVSGPPVASHSLKRTCDLIECGTPVVYILQVFRFSLRVCLLSNSDVVYILHHYDKNEMVTRLQKASAEIFKTLKERPIVSHSELQRIFRDNHEPWNLPQSLSFNKFVAFAIEEGKLQKHKLDFPHRPATRYSWGDVDLADIVQSIQPNGYFSHFTAMQLHDLTEQISKTIYFNVEQRLTGGGTEPTQVGINRAFKGKCRVTKNSVTVNDRTIRMLNGRNTGELGVTTIKDNRKLPKRVTNLERTLIDITVRPIYSGGVFQVAQAFEAASPNISMKRLVAYLRRLNFTYPYHQAIGYYLNRSGNFTEEQLAPVREFGTQFDFYLDYGMKKTDYVEEWRLYVPQGF